MYGKIFESLYRGSMVGAGTAMFAVWPYVIANMRADEVTGAQVDLNPKLLGFILGTTEEEIRSVIDKLCGPDPLSTSKNEEGRRLVKIGEFAYRVVNGAAYMEIRNEEERREYFRIAKRVQRRKNQVHARMPGIEKPVRGFQKPTVAEMKLYGAKAGLPDDECERCWNYYEANGWRAGKNPMRSWHAAMENWKKNWADRKYESSKNIKNSPRGFDRNKGTSNEGTTGQYGTVPAANT